MIDHVTESRSFFFFFFFFFLSYSYEAYLDYGGIHFNRFPVNRTAKLLDTVIYILLSHQ
jgi:hypothetical protein